MNDMADTKIEQVVKCCLCLLESFYAFFCVSKFDLKESESIESK